MIVKDVGDEEKEKDAIKLHCGKCRLLWIFIDIMN